MKLMDAQLEQAAPGSGLRERIMQRQRQRLVSAFCRFRDEGGGGSVLEVREGDWVRHGPKLMAGDRGARAQARTDAGMGAIVVTCALALRAQRAGGNHFGRSDGRQLLYGDGEFDWVCCDDVLEHAGGFMQQFDLLKEMNRVASKGVFVAATNRRYPIDLSSGLPLLHWLPAPMWHRLTGKAKGEGRHLLTARGLATMASLLPGKHGIAVGHVRLGGPKANLFLMVRKLP